MSPDNNIITANRKHRNIVPIVLAVSAVIAAVLLSYVLPWAQKVAREDEPQVALRTMRILLTIMFLSTVPFAVYILLFGRKVIRSRQMPPPGAIVLRDTKVVTGDSAVATGRIIAILGMLLVCIGLVGGLYLPYKIEAIMMRRIEQSSSRSPAEAAEQEPDATQDSP